MSEIGKRITDLSPEQRALLAKHLAGSAARQAPGAGAAAREPIAIVGASCRLPGGANDLDAFWRLLRDGVDAITPVPRERWDADHLYDEDPDAPGKVATRWGGFINDVDQFDAAYFGISPREAAEMDPQQRIVLETALDALDNAGMAREAIAGEAMGVFVGVHGHASDYLLLQNENLAEIDAFSGTGAAHNLLAGRLSYVLDANGPAVVVDTACSSSLVALHLAVQSLRSGESSSALVAGVNLILTPNFTVAASRMHMMAPDGRCKAFDRRADGFVRSEGCGVVVLRRLSDALSARDNILAVIRGSAVNQDGHTNGITAPNGLAQRRVIERALADAGVTAGSIGFVEAHGTGTSLGDPIEVEALAATVGKSGADAPPCFVGSVKTNVGHLEGAAGITGLIKAALVLRHGEVPPNLHFTGLNPHIRTTGTRLRFPVAVEPWRSGDAPRRAAVSSFGWSGTNAHVILEEAPPAPRSQETRPAHDLRILPISGHDPEAVIAMAQRFASQLGAEPQVNLDDVCYTAATRRSHHACRLAVTGRTAADMAQAIDDAVDQRPPPPAAGGAPRVAFVFPGHGAQWAGMGQDLLQSEPVFRDAIARIDAAIKAEAGWSLLELIASPLEASRLESAEFAQPAVFAFGVALAELWASWGVMPDAVIGHSMGEVAAAHVAGVLSLADATRLICRRSRLLQQVVARGGMLLVELSEDEARREIAAFTGRISIGAVNGPRSTVLAGDHAALNSIAEALAARDVFCRIVKGSPPGHSHLVADFAPVLAGEVAGTTPLAGSVPFYSTVREQCLGGEFLNSAYWADNLRQPVRFFGGVQALLRDGIDTLIELSPHPILSPVIGDIAAASDHPADETEAREVLALPSLRRDEDDHAVLYGTVGKLYERGAAIRWFSIAPKSGHLTALPPYAWQHKRYWLTRTPARRGTAAPVIGRVGEATDQNKMLYTAAWTEAPDSVVGAVTTGRYIVATGRGAASMAFAAALDAALKVAGGQALVVPEDDLALALDRASKDAAGWSGIIHCAALDATPNDAITAETLSADPVPGRESLVAVVRSLDQGGWIGEPKIWVVTRAAAVVSADDCAGVSVAQAPMGGLARAVQAEHPALFSSLIDLDPGSPLSAQAADVLRALTCNDNEPVVAFRSGRRRLQRLTPLLASPAPPSVTFRPDAGYVITGGLGGVGLVAARWMIERGARHLLVIGRTPLPPRSEWQKFDDDRASPGALRVAAVLELEALGAAIHYAAADVGDADALSTVLGQWRDDMRPRIHGIIHSAAVIKFSLVTKLERASIDNVFGAKARAAWLLHSLVPEADWLMLFSSAAALMPTAGDADYAAANAFLDALAQYRHGVGKGGPSVSWGLWKDMGAAKDAVSEAGRHFEQLGIRAFTADAGLGALDALLAQPVPHALVLNIERDVLGSRDHADIAHVLRGLTGPKSLTGAFAAAGRDAFLEQLNSANPATVITLLQQRVSRDARIVLKLDDVRVDVNKPLGEYGLNSLMGLELRARLERELALRLPAAIVFNYPSIAALSEYLASRLGQTAAPQPQTSTNASALSPAPVGPDRSDDLESSMAHIEALSDAAALAALRAGKTGEKR
jgi:acyl transferase domain-containing protein